MASSSKLRGYAMLPKIFGWPALIISFLARAPYAMIPLGVMTAFTASTGDVAVGGAATAVVSISTAISSPLLGRASDRFGQKPVLLVLVPFSALFLGFLAFLSLQNEPGALLWVACVGAGATIVPVGSFTRVRWVEKTTTPYQLSAAFSYESTADELVFVLGPALVGIAASASAPSAPLFLAFGLAVFVVLPFAIMAPRKLDSGERSSTEKPPSIPKVLWSIFPAIIVICAVGMYFGSVQAATTARAEDLGTPGSAGLAYAVMGIGSAIMALLVVLVPESFRFSSRLIVCGLGMGAVMLLVIPVASLPATAAIFFLGGLFVGPALVTGFSLTERLALPGGVSVALTSLQSSITVGVSLGAGIGGALAVGGATPTFFFAASVSLLIILAGTWLKLFRKWKKL